MKKEEGLNESKRNVLRRFETDVVVFFYTKATHCKQLMASFITCIFSVQRESVATRVCDGQCAWQTPDGGRGNQTQVAFFYLGRYLTSKVWFLERLSPLWVHAVALALALLVTLVLPSWSQQLSCAHSIPDTR